MSSIPAIRGAVDLEDVDGAVLVDGRAVLAGMLRSGQGWGVGPSTQFRALARMRATVVLPVPRTPENR